MTVLDVHAPADPSPRLRVARDAPRVDLEAAERAVADVVDHFARRLQMQERLTGHVADWLNEHLDPTGVGVVLEAEHTCMSLRRAQAASAHRYLGAAGTCPRRSPHSR
jgi:hypothetical protein